MDGKFLYFFISYIRRYKEHDNDIIFIYPENNELQPRLIYVDEKYENNYYYYNKVFKVSKSAETKKRNKYYFEFDINDNRYYIRFDSKGRTFVYEISLQRRGTNVIVRRNIEQKEYYEKIEYFVKALKLNGEENIIDDLYKDTISVYETKKGFAFLIILFVQIYKKKDLCNQLLQIFKKMNENSKYAEKNMDRKTFLKYYTEIFKSIISEADELIKNNNYNLIEFYGIILCYLNFYDNETFNLIINDLYIKRPEDLYEILLIYKYHFVFPINQNFDFFNKFISYIIENKDFHYFESGLKYINDLGVYLNIIKMNKKAIFEKYKYNVKNTQNIVKLDNLKFKVMENGLENNNNFINKKRRSKFEAISNIKSIINFCMDKNIFLIYFTNNFWRYLLNYYNEPTPDNIEICFRLRDVFIRYYDFALKVFDIKFTIKKEAINFYELDEFAFLLDQKIRIYNNNPEVTNIEKLALITKFDPYYREPKYFNKVDCGIFDFLDLEHIDNNFIKDFKHKNFEYIFKYNIYDYIKTFIEKIKNIANLDTVIRLINIKNLGDNNKLIYIDSLNKKFDKIISNEIGLLTDEKLKEAIHAIAKIAIINYAYEEENKKIDFINKRIKKLGKITPLILIEIINQCFNKKNNDKKEENENKVKEKKELDINIDIDYNELKKFIFEEFSNSLNDENDIHNIIKLIDLLEANENKIILNEFLQKLIEKNLFTEDEFFSCNQNIKISLLYKLYEKGIIKKNEEEYYKRITHLLDEIKKDIEGNIQKSKLEKFFKNERSLIIQRLSLIKLILKGFNPDEQYTILKKRFDDLNKR